MKSTLVEKFDGILYYKMLFVALITCSQCNGNKNVDHNIGLNLNHIQVIGSHNSYKQAIQTELLNYAISQDPDVADLAYSHIPIIDQLNLGLRIIELDIYHDPDGGRYNNPLGNQLLHDQGVDVLAFNETEELNESGFKVFHVQDIDFRSHCLRLEQCLSEINQWSQAHPLHLPLIITLNAKSDQLELEGSTLPLSFTEHVYDILDKEFSDGLGIENIITPQEIQQGYSTLNEAIKQSSWPSLNSCKGKFLLVLDEPIEKVNTYLSDTRKHKGIMFTNAPPGHESSAFIVSNDPLENEKEISKYVEEGYLVRTRADADTKEALRQDFTRFEAAKRSGAQFISTDYYYKTKEQPNFVIQFDGGTYVRCNPLMNREGCIL